MKRRILALVCAATLVLGMSLTVSAAGSSDSKTKAEEAAKRETVSIANSTGQVLTGATIAWFAEDTKITSGVAGAKINAVTDNNTAKAMIAEANRIVGSTAFIASLVDLEVPTGTGTAAFTLTCSNVWKGQNVRILHLKSDGTYEVITPSSVENNAVTFTMTSYSPIAIVIDTAALASPKTADTGLAAGMLIAVLAMAGAVAYRRKVME